MIDYKKNTKLKKIRKYSNIKNNFHSFSKKFKIS